MSGNLDSHRVTGPAQVGFLSCGLRYVRERVSVSALVENGCLGWIKAGILGDHLCRADETAVFGGNQFVNQAAHFLGGIGIHLAGYGLVERRVDTPINGSEFGTGLF